MSSDSAPAGSPKLSALYDGWGAYQRLLLEAVVPLTPDQLALRAAPGLRSAGEIAGHIISARVVWFHEVMGEGHESLAHMRAWDQPGAPVLNAAELEMGFEHTWSVIADALDRWTTDDLSAEFERRGERLSRQEIIWHVLEHDLHHGGEISLTLDIRGLRAPDM
ncbi:MAG TPA: DinB family protein [Ktedonobacterales bacterium]